MAKKAVLSPPAGPVTPAEIVGWFADAGIKKRPIPTEKDVAELAERLNRSIEVRQIRELPTEVSKQHLRMLANISLAIPYLAKAQPFLKEAIFFSDGFTGNVCNPLSGRHYSPVQDLIAASKGIEAILKHMPPRNRGRARESWPISASVYAHYVQEILLRSGWINADVSGDDSAIPCVVSKIILRTRGIVVQPNTIARRLRT